MNKSQTFGVVVFLVGLVITIIFPVFVSAEESVLFWVRLGFGLMGIGAFVLIISLCLERVKDNKKFRKMIKKEDLRP